MSEGRAPHGARGLKLAVLMPAQWMYCRAPHGARGLKYRGPDKAFRVAGRAPHGARGLKFGQDVLGAKPLGSRPARGAWIEIF